MTSKRYGPEPQSDSAMNEAGAKRETIDFEPGLHRALRLQAAQTHRSISEIVNDAVRLVVREDNAAPGDRAAEAMERAVEPMGNAGAPTDPEEESADRPAEPTIFYEALLKALKANGKQSGG
jgi:hypothetical protein